jgi:HKD family nuclease
LKGIVAARKISKVAFLRNDAWNVRYDAAHVEIGYFVLLQYKNNIFWIFKTAISRNCGKWMATCGMSAGL